MRRKMPLPYRYRLMLTITLTVLVPIIVVNFFTFSLVKQQMLEDSGEWLDGIIANTGSTMDSYLQLVQGTTKNPLFDYALMAIFDSKRPGSKDYVKEYSYEERAQVYGWLAMLAAMDKNILSTVMYDEDGRRFYLHEPTTAFNEKRIIRETKALGGASFISEPQYNEDGNIVFSISRSMINPANFKDSATLIVYFRLDFLGHVSGSESAESVQVKLIDKESRILMDRDRSNIGRVLALDDASISHAEYHSSLTNWTLVGTIPKAVLFEKIGRLQQGILLIHLVLVAATLILIYLFSSRLTRPLQKLAKVMQTAHRTEFREVSFPVLRHDEIGQIAVRFNQMMSEIEQLIDKVIDTEERRKQAQITASLAQFNPHFLYNSLYMITMQAELDQNYKISEMSFLLSKLLRYSVGKYGNWVTVSQECDHLQAYFRLMQYRFPKIGFSIDVEESANGSTMMRLILQPIVENAILHGVVPKDGNGKIRLSLNRMIGRGEDDNLSIVIEDDGIGMSQETLDGLLANLRTRKQGDHPGSGSGSGIGVRNVYERLELFYGDRFTFELSSEEGAGTRCRIVIPLMNELP